MNEDRVIGGNWRALARKLAAKLKRPAEASPQPVPAGEILPLAAPVLRSITPEDPARQGFPREAEKG